VGKAQHAGTVSPEARVASFSAEVIAAKKPFAVANGDGKPIGEITPEAVIDLLAGIDRSGVAK
jgi:glycine betaine/proline transport system ATP-binding protein